MTFLKHIASHHNVNKRTWHHGCMLWMKAFTIFTHMAIMASQHFHYWLCSRGNQLHQVKSLLLPSFYSADYQVCTIHVTCPNGYNMCQHWLYLNRPSFMYNFHFLSCRTIWPNIVIFLCLWHMKKTWQKQACIKIKDPTLHSNVLQELGNIMYDKDGPSRVGVEMWAMNIRL